MIQSLIKTDILIVGAGIAGLWLLNRLQQAGYSALLLENHTIGGGQTIASQGIIHGGTKYALTGALTQTGEAVADMPKRWLDCIQGHGEIDLTGVQLLSEHQYLWSAETVASRLAAFFASKTLRGRITALKKAHFPAPFNHPQFKGQVYELQEIVVDVPSLLQKLAGNVRPAILHTQQTALNFDADGNITCCEVTLADKQHLSIQAQRYILTAGAGNETLLKQHANLAPMQRRPLQMAVVKHHYPIPLYAHCMTANPKPRLTITTHTTADHKTVWYIGGLLAENGVQQTEAELIASTRHELADLFPWLDFTSAEICGYRVDRAEPAQTEGHLPGNTYLQQTNNLIIAWPTKLAMAPKLASDILLQLETLKPLYPLTPETLANYPHPAIAKPVWES